MTLATVTAIDVLSALIVAGMMFGYVALAFIGAIVGRMILDTWRNR